MSYLVTLVFSVAIVLVLSKIKAKTGYGIIFGVVVIYGFYVFPNVESIIEAIKWRMKNTTGVMTISFIDKTIEKSLFNPEYLDLLIKNFSINYWWVVWPLYFGVLLGLSKIVLGNKNA